MGVCERRSFWGSNGRKFESWGAGEGGVEGMQKMRLVVVCRVGCDYKQKNMGKKVKSEQCSGRWCSRHLFSIKSFFIRNEQTKQDTLRLCPRINKTTKAMECLLPQVNLDGKFYTPLFTLEEDRTLYVDYDLKNRESFLESQRLEEYEISEIMVPKHSSSKKYCKVCREDFNDYLEHIQSSAHLANSTSNRFTAYIAELQDRFQQKENRPDLKNTEEFKPILEDFMKSEDSTLPVQARNKTLPPMRESLMCLPFLSEPSRQSLKAQ